MKEIIAIIRPNKVAATKNALDLLGLFGMTGSSVLGRGKQKGIANEVSCVLDPGALAGGQGGSMAYIPKRLINIMVEDEDVNKAVKAIISVNQTGAFGDGKIFICPLDNALRVRTKEEGVKALQ